MKNQQMKIGAHVSIAGGYRTALRQARTLGANAIQIFAASPRSWKAPQPTPKEIGAFRRQAEKQKISTIFIHAKYLINLASQNPAINQKSVSSLVEDLKIAALIGANGVIFHPHLGRNRVLKENLLAVLNQSPPKTKLILENAATTDLNNLVDFFQTLNHPRLRLCLDTAHLFQSGLAINTTAGMAKMLSLINRVGWEKVALIHANDSRTVAGSRHDVHEDIGEGQLTNLPFVVLINHPSTKNLPFILETPAGKNDLTGQKRNLNRIRALGGKKLPEVYTLKKPLPAPESV